MSVALEIPARRQKQFLFSVRAPYYEQESALRRGAKRYKNFLLLLKKNPNAVLVPMYDIDLVWHAHILRSTSCYARDCESVVGRFVDHREDEDRGQGGGLQGGFRTTAALWRAMYGEEYADGDTNYKGKMHPRVRRVMPRSYSILVASDDSFRSEFIRAVVCRSCAKGNSRNNHPVCTCRLAKAVRDSRGGQAQGGACGALYYKGLKNVAAFASTPGGACAASTRDRSRRQPETVQDFMASVHEGGEIGPGGVDASTVADVVCGVLDVLGGGGC